MNKIKTFTPEYKKAFVNSFQRSLITELGISEAGALQSIKLMCNLGLVKDCLPVLKELQNYLGEYETRLNSEDLELFSLILGDRQTKIRDFIHEIERSPVLV